MSENGAKEYYNSPEEHNEPTSASKRPRLEDSALKNWYSSDKRTDPEALQEMGVSVLEPDDIETIRDLESNSLLKSASKRKRDIENVNPNVNSASKSPRRAKTSPVAGPSNINVRPDFQTENLKQKRDEETPEQFVEQCSRLIKSPGFRRREYTPGSTEKESGFIRVYEDAHSPLPSVGPDAFARLSDEVMLGIFQWLPKRTLAHCMRVCKRWHNIANDETFWQRLDLGNIVLVKNELGKVLSKKPVVLRLANTEVQSWHPPTAIVQSRLQYLDLSNCTIDLKTLYGLLQRCEYLKKLSLESVGVDSTVCSYIGRCSKLETLNLAMARGINEDGLQSILDGCQSLVSMNISWTGLCKQTVKTLCEKVPEKVQRLNLSGLRKLSDDMVSTLTARCTNLIELDLSDCSDLSARSIAFLISLEKLHHLSLSRCYKLVPNSLTKLGNMPSLQYLEIWGMLQEASLSTLKSALPSIQVNQFMHSAIARPTVGPRRTSIWGLRTRD